MEKCKVGIVGVGVMASGTAALTICNSHPTVMYARTAESCEKGVSSSGISL
jgi:3-hydroxyacyl-CoA dehydrogenase